jgi:pyridoxamine 5'-phosphate oxidase
VDPLLRKAYDRFGAYQETVRARAIREPDAVILATSTSDGRPSSRVVLLRGVDDRGFVFYTNSLSRKGKQLAENPFASLCFYCDDPARQVRIEGRVEQVDDVESDLYWSGRERGSRIGAWASLQSELLPDQERLKDAVADYERKFADLDDVPRPQHWFGYRVVPDRIEFWEGRPSRLHERCVYEQRDEAWVTYELFP